MANHAARTENSHAVRNEQLAKDLRGRCRAKKHSKCYLNVTANRDCYAGVTLGSPSEAASLSRASISKRFISS
jgi:hypothetical protein